MQPVVEQNNWGAPLQQQQFAQPSQYPQPHHQQPPSFMKRERRGLFGKLKSMKFWMFVIVVLQLVTLFFLINPINLINQLNSVQVINRVASKVSVPPNEVPQVIARVGDIQNLPTADDLRKENEIQAEVYKEAVDGDYVLLYTSKMIIYRESTDTVLYEGDTPATIVQKAQQQLLEKVVAKAKAQGVIASDSQEQPQLSTITDAAKLRQENAVFYADAANQDIIALFPTAGKVLLYRPTTDAVINSGSFNLNIN